MAFLCPVRIRRGKKKKADDKDVVRGPGMGRITGSASIETLVRVGLEKEAGLSPDSKMVVLHDFTPCVDDELEVKRGSVVNVLYQENDWVYVIAENQREGFIPHSYCATYGSHLGDIAINVKKKLPREPNLIDKGGGGGGGANATTITNTTANTTMASTGENDHNTTIGTINSNGAESDNDSYGGTKSLLPTTSSAQIQILPPQSNFGSNHTSPRHLPSQQSSTQSLNSQSSQPDVHPFFKDPSGRFIVLYTFIARDENDVSVERGEFVTVLNREDPDWYWVVRSDGQEGFVPSAFVYPADAIHGHVSANVASINQSQYSNLNTSTHATNPAANEDGRCQGTELVMLYDYKAQAPDDLSVRRGDWVYADLSHQTIDGWLWTYAPKSRKYGFIPKAYARPPAMTSL
nr:EOG090X083C [Triops cancriformis]